MRNQKKQKEKMKKEKTYFMGLVKKSQKTVILQLRNSVDSLSCELFQYFGERINTKANLVRQKKQLLEEINKSYKTNFQHIIID